ncbi:hypothetical protein AciM339_0754 [Aciduliprofundum sp. MAR08-339]|nr:hypothetical protein AciM339_0754 [Aciduliprofundum sp. MAR08-339]
MYNLARGNFSQKVKIFCIFATVYGTLVLGNAYR